MKRYNKQFFKMVESNDGKWVSFDSIQVADDKNVEMHNEIIRVKAALENLINVTDAKIFDLEKQIVNQDALIYALQYTMNSAATKMEEHVTIFNKTRESK